MPCPDVNEDAADCNKVNNRHGGDKKQEERRLILHYFLSSSLCLLCKIVCLFIYCGLFHLCWCSFCSGCFPQFLACSSMPSFFPMVYLALTTAILHRVAQFAGFQWAQRCFGFAACGAAENGGGGSSFEFIQDL